MRSAFFLEGSAGSLFCTGFLHPPETGQRRRFLIIPPFAEELNKSRHVLAALAAAIGEAGHDVLMPDLFGTGDSAGDFSQATLGIWRTDLDTVIELLGAADGLELIGLRAGALLAADTATRHESKTLTLLHPVHDGRQQLTQMLRLRLAGSLMSGGEQETMAQLKQRLAAGECLEIGGYGLSGQLAGDLETLSLKQQLPSHVACVNWMEVAREAKRPLMPASQGIIDAWRGSGVSVDSSVVACDQFWATQEIARCSGLVREAVRRLLE
jgi:exosortase A-associated hydrolase 2